MYRDATEGHLIVTKINEDGTRFGCVGVPGSSGTPDQNCEIPIFNMRAFKPPMT